MEGSMNSPTSKILDTISSWLELDEPGIVPPPHLQQLQDLQMLDENFFQFANTTATTTTNMDYEHPYSECNLLPNLPIPGSPFSQPEDHYYHPVLHGHTEIINLDQPVDNEAECEKYLNIMAESSPQSIGVDQYFQIDSDNHITMASSSTSSSVSDVPQQPRLKKQKTDNIEKPPKLSTKRHQSTIPTTAVATTSTVADDDDEEEEIDDEPKRGTLNCKNLVSERNRRKRLRQQLLGLRALVPNITKMDKQSVLVDALSYLRSMQEETAKLQKEFKEQQLLQQHQPRLMNNAIMEEDEDEEHEHDLDDDTHPRTNTRGTASQPSPQIIEIDIEKMEEKRFVVKITCKGVNGIAGDVFRTMESTGFEITYAALDQIEPQHVLSTVFIKVKKQEKMTEEKLKDSIIHSALRCGLTILSTC